MTGVAFTKHKWGAERRGKLGKEFVYECKRCMKSYSLNDLEMRIKIVAL